VNAPYLVRCALLQVGSQSQKKSERGGKRGCALCLGIIVTATHLRPSATLMRRAMGAQVREYGQQLGVVERMHNEIISLQALVSAQESRLMHLKRDHAALRREAAAARQPGNVSELECAILKALPCNYRTVDHGMLWGCVSTRSPEFLEMQRCLHDGVLAGEAELTPHTGAGAPLGRFSLRKMYTTCFPVDHPVITAFVAHDAQRVAPPLQRLLFYAGPLDDDALDGWFERGLPQSSSPELDPFELAIYGRGFYFSPSAAAAHAHASCRGRLLVCLVTLGNVVTVVTPDPHRRAPPQCRDSLVVPDVSQQTQDKRCRATSPALHSMVVPGRQLPTQRPPNVELHQSPGVSSGSTEYVVFDGRQALPMYSLTYSVAPFRQPLEKKPTGVSRQ
jgi:hypothetical protein